MFAMKIQMDEEKILREDVINLVKVYKALDEIFAEKGFIKGGIESDGTIYYHGSNKSTDFATSGSIVSVLKYQSWFIPNCKKWLWGDNETLPNEAWDWEDVLAQQKK